mmetsp:Transcript_13651/g.20016  ORF Transcript_13651/g.20016 Transcript_13651/m.20016 type:complete len:102 (-) Transcript_13651:596-901(-)
MSEVLLVVDHLETLQSRNNLTVFMCDDGEWEEAEAVDGHSRKLRKQFLATIIRIHSRLRTTWPESFLSQTSCRRTVRITSGCSTAAERSWKSRALNARCHE